MDDKIREITTAILEAERQAVPMKQIKSRSFQLNPRTKALIASRNTIRRRFQRNRDPSQRLLIAELNQEIDEEISKQINDEFQEKLEDISHNDSLHVKMWKLTKNLKRRNTHIPPLMDKGKRIVSAKEKVDIFKEEILKANQLTHKDTVTTSLERRVKRSIDTLKNDTVLHPPESLITVGEIRNHIASLKVRKAAGPDGMGNRCLKHLPSRGYQMLSKLFNACIKLSYFHQAWKEATVLTFRKPGKDPKLPANYRPISLLCSLSKILERCLLSVTVVGLHQSMKRVDVCHFDHIY
jgi:hypothetical protein